VNFFDIPKLDFDLQCCIFHEEILETKDDKITAL